MGFFGKYVSKKGAKKLLEYKYHGSDDSWIYNNVTSPYIYNRIAENLPHWLAPNLITISGLSLMVMAHVIQASYLPRLQGIAPAWVHMLNGVCLLLYQTFDAVDGKQARKTGSSSPMGLIFDHGCDAIVTTIVTLTLASAAQLGPTWKSMLLWISMAVPFFGATYEEFYTGELHLPVINGPNEGLLLTALFHFISAYTCDDPFWLKESIWGLKFNELGLICFVLAAIATFGENVWNVYKCIISKKSNYENERAKSNYEKQRAKSRSVSRSNFDDEEDDSEDDEEFHPDPMSLSGIVGSNTLMVAISRFAPLAAIIACVTLFVIYSPSDIMDRRPIAVIWTVGLLFSKLLTGLMLAHICDEEYHPATRTITAVLCLCFHVAYVVHMFADEKKISKYEDFALDNFIIVAAVSYTHMFLGIILEFGEILGIYVFTITTKKEKVKVR